MRFVWRRKGFFFWKVCFTNSAPHFINSHRRITNNHWNLSWFEMKKIWLVFSFMQWYHIFDSDVIITWLAAAGIITDSLYLLNSCRYALVTGQFLLVLSTLTSYHTLLHAISDRSIIFYMLNMTAFLIGLSQLIATYPRVRRFCIFSQIL